jgi:hypothetical protein
MYHLYKIIGRATSFRYNSISIRIYEESDYKTMTIAFVTENKTNEYHIRCKKICSPVHKTSFEHTIEEQEKISFSVDGISLCSALSRFEPDTFSGVSFAFHQRSVQNTVLTLDTKNNYTLALRGKTDMIKGKVCVPVNVQQHSLEILQSLRKEHFSLEILIKCIHFYHLSVHKHIELVYYPVSNRIMLIFIMKRDSKVEILLPSLQKNAFDRYSYSSSDSE